jgi:hypothetical protein
LRASRPQPQDRTGRPLAAAEPRQPLRPEETPGRLEERLGRPDERLGRLNQRILSENQLNSPRLTQERSIFPSFENLKVIYVWTKLFLAGNLLDYSRGCMHSPFFWRRNPTKTLGFLLPWISPWFFFGFLLSPPLYAQSFIRKPSFLVLAHFFPWF